MYRKTYVEINTDNLKYNVKTLTEKYSGYGYYIGVVKGNVYGHGAESVKSLIDTGINYLAVSSLEEAIAIRGADIHTPILLLQPIHLENVGIAVKNNITITLSSYEYFKKLITHSQEQELKVHLKINSGFNRLGVSDKDQVKEIVDALQNSKNFNLEGIYSHLMTSGLNDNQFDKQITAFKKITSEINLKDIPIVHLDRSLTLGSHEKLDFCTGVRIGIAMYGYNQSFKQKSALKSLATLDFNKKVLNTPNILKPAFSLYSEIIDK